MIRRVICMISMVIVFTMLCSSCNDLPPAENPSNSASAGSSPTIQFAPLTEEEREHLRTVRDAVCERENPNYWTVQNLESACKLRDENPEEHFVLFEPFRKEVACDPTRDEYHSPQVAALLQQGIFINEVRELLGRPHETICLMLSDTMALSDTYTAYTLDDGRVLLLRFIQASIKDYSREELERRVPNFNERDWVVRCYGLYSDPTAGNCMGWLKLQELKILTLEEYLETNLYTRTPQEELPEEYKNGGGIIWRPSSDN